MGYSLDFKSRDQEKNRLASIFAYGEDFTIEEVGSTETTGEIPAQISRFDERKHLFNSP